MVQIGRALGPGRAETSFTEHVNELRLKRAFMLLKAEREGHACISDIGLQAGFSDISHFNWVFRARFGDTPSGVTGIGRAEIMMTALRRCSIDWSTLAASSNVDAASRLA